jgi:hypothetical protein
LTFELAPLFCLVAESEDLELNKESTQKEKQREELLEVS